MARRRLLLGAATALVVLAVPVDVGVSHAEPWVQSTATALGGWSGSDPVPVGLGEAADRAVTAAFTTVPTDDHADDGSGRDLWVADKPAAGDWATPVRVDSGVAPGAVFAENDTGSAVLAWDSATDEGGSVLTVSTRAAGNSWSSPIALVTDGRSSHQPVVGIDNAGAATVAYVQGSEPAVVTRQFTDGVWSEPLVHSTAPVQQIRLSVSSTGFGTLAWVQVEENGSLQAYTGRLLPSAVWEPPVAVDGTGDNRRDPRLVMLALDTADDGHAALTDANTDADARGVWWASNLQSYNQGPPPYQPWLSDFECEPDCTIKWYGRQNGGNSNGVLPQAAVADMTSEPWDTVLDIRSAENGELGQWEVSAQASNGTEWGRGVRLSAPGGANVDPAMVQRGYRALVSWVRREPDGTGGDVLQVRAVSAGFDDHVIPDPGLATLGPISGTPVTVMSATGDTAVVWTDPTTPGVLRSATFTANTIVVPDHEFSTDDRVPVSWSTTGPSTVRYDVRVKQARASAGFGSYRAWKTGTRAKAADYRAVGGRTLCFSTRAHGSAGSTSSWSAARCTVVPINDTALRGRGWHRQTAANAYGRELRTAGHAGRSLSVRRVRARTIALLVSRGPHTGAVRVRLGSRSLGTFNTRGHHQARAVIAVAHLARVHSGRLQLTTTSAKPVRIDGVFVSNR